MSRYLSAVIALAFIVMAPAPARAQGAATLAMIAAHLSPGQRIRVVLRRPPEDSLELMTESDLHLEGALVDIDSGGLSLKLGDGSVRRVDRREGETFRAHEKSRRKGVLGGLLLSVPVFEAVCQGHNYECDEGSAVLLGGMLIGGLVGWRQWSDVRFPPR